MPLTPTQFLSNLKKELPAYIKHKAGLSSYPFFGVHNHQLLDNESLQKKWQALNDWNYRLASLELSKSSEINNNINQSKTESNTSIVEEKTLYLLSCIAYHAYFLSFYSENAKNKFWQDINTLAQEILALLKEGVEFNSKDTENLESISINLEACLAEISTPDLYQAIKKSLTPILAFDENKYKFYKAIKTLGHAFALDGKVPFYSNHEAKEFSLSLEGINFNPIIIASVHKFWDKFCEQKRDPRNEKLSNTMQNIKQQLTYNLECRNGGQTETVVNKIMTDYHAGKTILLQVNISTGDSAHAIFIMLQEKNLYICDSSMHVSRLGAQGGTIKHYSIANTASVTTDIVKSVLHSAVASGLKLPPQNFNTFFENSLHTILNTTLVNTTFFPAQKVGNCVFESINAAILGAIQIEHNFEKAQTLVNEWREFYKINLLEAFTTNNQFTQHKTTAFLLINLLNNENTSLPIKDKVARYLHTQPLSPYFKAHSLLYSYLDENQYTNTHLVAYENHLDLQEYLLQELDDTHLKNMQYNIAFLLLIVNWHNDNTENMLKILKFFPNLSHQIIFEESSLIHLAIYKNNLTLLQYLIEHTTVVNKNTAHSIVSNAIAENKIEAVTMLIDNGYTFNNENKLLKDCQPEIYTAVEYDNVPILELLLNKGANPNIKNTTNIGGREALYETPLHLAAEKEKKIIIEILIKNGALINIKDYFGFTPLDRIANKKLKTFVANLAITHRTPEILFIGHRTRDELDIIQAQNYSRAFYNVSPKGKLFS